MESGFTHRHPRALYEQVKIVQNKEVHENEQVIRGLRKAHRRRPRLPQVIPEPLREVHQRGPDAKYVEDGERCQDLLRAEAWH